MSGKGVLTVKSEEHLTQEKIAGFLPVNVRRGQNGMIKSMMGKLVLYKSMGHVYTIKGVTKPSAAGYNELNKFAGVQLIMPPTIEVNGMVRNNPYIEREENGMTIKAIHGKMIGLGRAQWTGNKVTINTNICYTPSLYFLRDLVNIDKKDVIRKVILTPDFEKEPGMWYVPLVGNFALEVDINHEEVWSKVKTFTENTLFAERKAITILRRNTLKHHPAIAVDTLDYDEKTGTATVPIVGWRITDMSFEEMLEDAEKVSRGEKPTDVEIKDVDVTEAEIVEAHEDPTDDFGESSLFDAGPSEVETINVQEPPEEKKPEPKTEPQPEPEKEKKTPKDSDKNPVPKREHSEKALKILNHIKELQEYIAPAKFNKIVQEIAGTDPLDQLDELALKKIQSECQKAM